MASARTLLKRAHIARLRGHVGKARGLFREAAGVECVNSARTKDKNLRMAFLVSAAESFFSAEEYLDGFETLDAVLNLEPPEHVLLDVLHLSQEVRECLGLPPS